MSLTEYMPEVSEEYKPLLAAAFTMAEKAGEIQMRYFRKAGLQQSAKLNDSDIVTIADKESEASILEYIHQNFPSHGIISEYYCPLKIFEVEKK